MRQMRRPEVRLSDYESGPKRCVSLPARYALKNRQNGRENAQTERYFRGFVGLYVARGLCYDRKAA